MFYKYNNMFPAVAVGIVVDNKHNIIYYYEATTQCTRGYNEYNISVKIFTTAVVRIYLG